MALVDPNRIKASIAQDKVVNRPGGIMQPKFNLGKVEEPSIFNFGYWREEKAPLLAAWMKMDPKEQDRPDPGLTFGNLAPFKPMEDAFPRTSVGFPKDEPKAITTFSPEDGDLVGRFDGQRGYVGTDTSAAVADALLGNSVAASDAAPSVSKSIGIMSKPSSAEQEINIPKEGSASTISKLSKLEKPNDDTEYLVKSEGIYAPAAKGYSKASIKSYSNYNTPLEETGIRGNSRIGGDASSEVQEASIKAIIKYGKQFGMTKDQLAYTLATARVESGFNPDAAAGTTSASGLGQFTKETGDSYGLNDTNRFDLDTNAQALVLHTLDNYDLARRRKKPDSYVYKYHHDGASGEYGGLAVYNSKVKPSISIYKALLDENGYKPSGTPMDRQLAVDNLNSPLSLQKSPRPKPRPESIK